jgi:hypothetical protein
MAPILLYPCIMSLRARLPHAIAALFIVGLAQACGGKTLEGSRGGIEPDDDSGITTGSGVESGTTDGSAECVDLEVAPSDLSCVSDQDCALSLTGNVCEGQCACGDTSVNAAAAARYQSETAALTFEACPCPAQGEPRCLGGQCTLCGFGPNPPAGCDDTGIITIEDGGIFDGSEVDSQISDADAGTCVDIDLSTYDSSCNQASDCIVILTQACSGACACGGLPVNASEQSRYQQEISGITLVLCPCGFETTPQCIDDQCIILDP